jgi:hypothetical protein
VNVVDVAVVVAVVGHRSPLRLVVLVAVCALTVHVKTAASAVIAVMAASHAEVVHS